MGYNNVLTEMEMSWRVGYASPKVNLNPNVQKILSAIAYVIALGEKRQFTMTQYDILKILFIADKAHLNKYGRPITFDNYYAMRSGPVPSLAYDFLKEERAKMEQLRIDSFPWSRREIAAGQCEYFNADPGALNDNLSESDKNSLSDALVTIKSLTFSQIRKLTHHDPAYEEAWRDEGDQKMFQMSVGMLFDSPNFAKAEVLAFQSNNA